MDKMFNKLRNLDAYPKVNEDFYNRTLSGGIITLVSATIMLLLFFSEFSTCPIILFDFFFFFGVRCYRNFDLRLIVFLLVFYGCKWKLAFFFFFSRKIYILIYLEIQFIFSTI